MSGVSNPYAAGDKVYNGGSSAATQGAVDPMGYIDRSLNNTPSPANYTPGVAAGALNTLRSASPTAAPQPTQTATPNPTASTTASTTGQISWKMPVDYDLQLKGISANSQLQNLLVLLNAQRNSATQDRVTGLRDLGQAETQTTRRDLNTAAYRGMARSSGYVNQVDQTQKTFNNARTDIEARFLAALNGASAQELQGNAEYDDIMSAIYREAAARLAEKRTEDPDSGALTDPVKGGNTPSGIQPQPAPSAPKPNTTAKPAPKPTPKPAPKPSGTSTKPKTIRAARGESLASLAKKYKTTVRELVRINPQLKRANGKYVVYANSQVRIPQGGK